MDNLTHSLIGLTAAKAGLERLSPGATTLCVLAANAPDTDIVVLIFRDAGHFYTTIAESRIRLSARCAWRSPCRLVFYLGDRILAQLRKREPRVRLKGLVLASVLATATHPIHGLDEQLRDAISAAVESADGSMATLFSSSIPSFGSFSAALHFC